MPTSRASAGARRLALRAGLVAGLALLAPGAAWARSVPSTLPPNSAGWVHKKVTSLRVENDNWLDLHLCVVRDGESFSLGTVMGPGKTRPTVPAMATIPGSQVQLLVLPIGSSDDYLSPPLVVEPGDTLNLTVENDLSMSSVTVSEDS